MADISKITLPNNSEYDLKDATARSGLASKQDKITVNGLLQGDGSGNISAATIENATEVSIDSTPTQDSNNLVTSGGVYAAIAAGGGGGGSTYYGECSTPATTQAKVVSISDITELSEGLSIRIRFDDGCKVNNPTLNLNSLGAKNILRKSGLPTAYTELLGFSFDNSGYFEITDLKLNGSDTVRFTVGGITTACNVFGCYTESTSTNNYSLYATKTSGGKYLRYGSGTYDSYFSDAGIYNIVITPTGSSGMPTDSTWSALTFTGTADLCIGTSSSSATSSKLVGRLIGHFIVEGRFDGIPCKRVSDNTLGYYDTVSQTFYTPESGTITALNPSDSAAFISGSAMYGEWDAGDVLDLVYDGSNWVIVDPKEIFVFEYGQGSYTDIENAAKSGKIVYCDYRNFSNSSGTFDIGNPPTYIPLTYLSAPTATFSGFQSRTLVSITVSDTSWKYKGINLLNNLEYYATCSTAASTATKEVVCSSILNPDYPSTGTHLRVKFDNANTVNNAQIKLVNTAGSSTYSTKSIYLYYTSSNNSTATANMWQAGEVVDFIYDGTRWIMVNGGLFKSISDKISAPSSPSDGDILTYDSTSGEWSATALPTELPTQSSATANKYLKSDGTSASWEAVSSPTIASTTSLLKGDNSGNAIAATSSDYIAPPSSPSAGDVLSYDSTNGWVAENTTTAGTLGVDTTVTASSNNLITSGAVATALSNVDSLPSQSGNSGKYLTTNGTSASWESFRPIITLTSDYVPIGSSYNHKIIKASINRTAIDILEGFSVGDEFWIIHDNDYYTDIYPENGSVYINGGTGSAAVVDLYQRYSIAYFKLVKIESGTEYWNATVSSASESYIPPQSGNSGKYLTTNGSVASWATVDALPSQTGNSGKYLTTDGTSASWGTTSATSTKSIDSAPTSSSSNLVTSGGVYTAINNKVNRTTAVNAADTNYTTLMARGIVMLDSTTYDAVSDWSTYLVNGSIAWRYE